MTITRESAEGTVERLTQQDRVTADLERLGREWARHIQQAQRVRDDIVAGFAAARRAGLSDQRIADTIAAVVPPQYKKAELGVSNMAVRRARGVTPWVSTGSRASGSD